MELGLHAASTGGRTAQRKHLQRMTLSEWASITSENSRFSEASPKSGLTRTEGPQGRTRWGEVFGDITVAAAMIDRLVHHAEVIALKGDSYRLKDRDLGHLPDDDAA